MPDRHHQVPMMLLRNFAADEKIWLFDKHQNKSFQTNIRNAFVEGDYNTVVGDTFSLEAEQIFGRAEDLAAPVLQDILDKKDIKHLSDEDRSKLTVFVAIQHMRSKQSRKTFTLLREHMQKNFPGIPQSQFEIDGLKPSEADKYASLDFIVKNLNSLAQHVSHKHFMLVELAAEGGFWISDHPVVLHNDNKIENQSNRGFGVDGIQIYLPISPSYAVAFFCPTLIRELEAGAEKVKGIKSRIVADSFARGDFKNRKIEDINLHQSRIEKTLVDMRDKQKIHFNKDNLEFLNSHQVLSSHRFVGARDNSFEMVVDMLAKDPTLREPSHIAFG